MFIALAAIAGIAVAILPTALGVLAAILVVLATIAIVRRPDTPPAPPPTATPSPLHDFTTLIRPLNEGVLILDADLNVLATNPAAARIVDRPLDSMLHVSLIQAVRDHELVDLARGVSGGERTPMRLSVANRDVLAAAVGIEAGEARALLVMEDITTLLHAQRARSELVANVSHELRTPIAAARALAETLQAGVDEPDERERFLTRLTQELEHLGDIVQRLLRLARLESGVEPFEVEAMDPRVVIDEATSRIAPLAAQRGIHIETAPDDTRPVLADRDRLLEVLSNLLDNAVRHSPDGETVTLRTVADDGFVRFEVRDRGPGILPVDRERIFERFYTGERARTPGTGSGLGLAIARHIVQRLGGRIWIADHPDPGALVCFTLPPAETTTESAGHNG